VVVDEAGDADADIGKRRPGKNRNAVVALLPGECRRVLRRLDLHQRELRVLDLRFLQANDIGLRLRSPVDQMREPDLEGVDIPGREFHGVAQ
jgi:hypothetical protein